METKEEKAYDAMIGLWVWHMLGVRTPSYEEWPNPHGITFDDICKQCEKDTGLEKDFFTVIRFCDSKMRLYIYKNVCRKAGKIGKLIEEEIKQALAYKP
jgi:hypothetical protein